VVVLERCALTPDDVLGYKQLSFRATNLMQLATAIKEVVNNEALKKELVNYAAKNVERFTPDVLKEQIQALTTDLAK
jgi:hypothetical protein